VPCNIKLSQGQNPYITIDLYFLFKNTHNFTFYMLCFPNCKINLGLYITRLRDDSYHDIETVFYSVAINDVLEIVPVSSAIAVAPAEPIETHLKPSGLTVAGDQKDNLVWKAYKLLRKAFPLKVTGVDIYLHKVIPMGAGLGGGSADGAFMLRLLNDYYQLNLNKPQLAIFALELGSDCPFFIYNTPQFATGRGEQMNDISLDLSPYSIQLICPPVHMPTSVAFQLITPKQAAFDLRTLPELPIEQWKDTISNDFEAPVFNQHPVLADIKRQLYDGGAFYASMSGSGSAIYGIFAKGKKAEIKTDVGFEGFYAE